MLSGPAEHSKVEVYLIMDPHHQEEKKTINLHTGDACPLFKHLRPLLGLSLY